MGFKSGKASVSFARIAGRKPVDAPLTQGYDPEPLAASPGFTGVANRQAIVSEGGDPAPGARQTSETWSGSCRSGCLGSTRYAHPLSTVRPAWDSHSRGLLDCGPLDWGEGSLAATAREGRRRLRSSRRAPTDGSVPTPDLGPFRIALCALVRAAAPHEVPDAVGSNEQDRAVHQEPGPPAVGSEQHNRPPQLNEARK